MQLINGGAPTSNTSQIDARDSTSIMLLFLYR